MCSKSQSFPQGQRAQELLAKDLVNLTIKCVEGQNKTSHALALHKSFENIVEFGLDSIFDYILINIQIPSRLDF